VLNAGTITTLSNAGTITGVSGDNGVTGGVGAVNNQTITTLTNSGTISGGNGENGGRGGTAFVNTGTITTLTNTGRIVGGNEGGGGGAISNFGTIAALTNKGIVGAGAGGSGVGVYNGGTITTLTNSGAIKGSSGGLGFGAGIWNQGGPLAGTIKTLTNNGAIQGGTGGNTATSGGNGSWGVYNEAGGTIESLTNHATGAISGGNGGSGGKTGGAGGAGISSTKTAVFGYVGTIKTLTNSGVVSGGVGGSGGNTGGAGGAGISNTGTIAALTNRGTIEGGNGGTGPKGNGAAGDAILSAGPNALIGPIANSGQIIGNVEIDNQASVIIKGGSGTTFGSFSGGAITIGAGDLTFAGGNTDLADSVAVNGGAGTVTNEGVLRLAAPETITGNFVQTASGAFDSLLGGDALGQYGSFTVTSLATLDGRLALDLTNGFTLAAGDSFELMTFSGSSGDFTEVSFDGAACSAGSSDMWLCHDASLNLDLGVGSGEVDLTVVAATQLAVVGPDLARAAIPEPSTWVMLATGFLGLAGQGLRGRRRALPP
jgi:hypothetical protein